MNSQVARVLFRVRQASATRRLVARFKQAGWDGKFVGKDARLQWSRATWQLEELPQKGKKKLRQATLQNPYDHGQLDWWIPGNILNMADLSTSDNYDKIKDKIADAYKEAYKRTMSTDPNKPANWGRAYLEKNDWVEGLKWYEHQVFYLEVIPENAEPFKAEGEDFTVDVSWSRFRAYSPQSDFNQSDPFYMSLESKSPTAARKLYNLLKTDPKALKSTPYSKFEEWLRTQKIPYDHGSSSWH